MTFAYPDYRNYDDIPGRRRTDRENSGLMGVDCKY